MTDIPLGSPVPVIERRTSRVAGYVRDSKDPNLLHFYEFDRAGHQLVFRIRTDDLDRVARHRAALKRYLAAGQWERMEVAPETETHWTSSRAFALEPGWVLVDDEPRDQNFYMGPMRVVRKLPSGDDVSIAQTFVPVNDRPIFGRCWSRTTRGPSDRLGIRFVAYDKVSRRVWIRYAPRVPMDTHCDTVESYEVLAEEPPYIGYHEEFEGVEK